jgi:protein-tyrosine phosphatase
MRNSETTRVLFVCLGNICRSPTAHGVMLQRLEEKQLHDRMAVDSCGTGGWHTGESPDRRATAAARKRGYDLSGLRARQVVPEDFRHFDYILAMDRANLSELQALRPPEFAGHLGLFLDFAPGSDIDEVPDPYYGGGDGFARVLDLIERACDGLLEALARAPGD